MVRIGLPHTPDDQLEDVMQLELALARTKRLAVLCTLLALAVGYLLRGLTLSR